MVTVNGLYFYPIKACAGVAVSQLEFDALGPRWDRRWMLVDESGVFLTQRRYPRLAHVSVSLQVTPDGVSPILSLSAPSMPAHRVADSDRTLEPVDVSVWSYQGSAVGCDTSSSHWFSEYLGRPVRLVRVSPTAPRRVDPDYAPGEHFVGFADGFPVLLVSQPSLDDLCIRAGRSFEMQRFRPNVVVDGCAPGDEDAWKTLAIGDLELDLVKPCERCMVTTIDPVTLETDKEPLHTLATYRRGASGVTFGQNCVHRGAGVLRVGDEVRVLSSASR